jgi:integration host factor subunit beta
VTKKEIVKTICDRANNEKLMKSNLTQLATKEIVQWTFEAIIETLVQEGRIELRNFGVFEVKQRKPRKARNPRTGARVDVEAKNVVTFQPGKEIEEQVKKFAKPAESKKKPRKGKVKGEPKTPEPKAPEPKSTPASVNGTASTEASTPGAPKPAPQPVTSDAPAST